MEIIAAKKNKTAQSRTITTMVNRQIRQKQNTHRLCLGGDLGMKMIEHGLTARIGRLLGSVLALQWQVV